ncbi:5-deoxy-glucuronate isomerase [Sandaracinus amylolyticus]|uniref:5-deoxy-glucuronate isomerase n=1 Tax=Sandaracinus amylolyticus TaxID=927083 RepID=A0A0F6YGN3_9BACT|nr:5-deoxy-glucuronate isomerase [Sandaracinus amylolyticus]AKF03051.1 5-deoxy-glucuronate isomerase [Sandaracinus amylolyticus]
MALHLTEHRAGLSLGTTEIVKVDDADGTGIGLAVVKLAPGERLSTVTTHETAWLLMDGEVDVHVGPRRARWSRRSLWDEAPSCVHVAAGAEVTFEAQRAVELTRYETASTRRFAASLYAPDDVREEHRGWGQVRGACHRVVRTVFDRDNADEAAELVLGEVITLPGRWSSYPPHHHAQPEIYHYRFTHPQGYGHAELGDAVVKVRGYDTVKIPAGHVHAQVAAPGYGMYYAWVIRHLPGAPYIRPTFDAEHAWVMEPGARTWWPEGVE